MAFTVKVGKSKKHGKNATIPPSTLCDRPHCTLFPDHCTDTLCQFALEDGVGLASSGNLSMSLALDGRKETLQKLTAKVRESCDLQKYLGGSIAASEEKGDDATLLEAERVVCECSACLLEKEVAMTEMLGKETAAVEKHLADLREYRTTHDREAAAKTTDQ